MAVGRRSSRDEWLLAGQQLLRAGGAPAVKLADLAKLLGLTTGSFYHHFGGMLEYLDELAAFYGTGQVDAAVALVAGLGPRARLEQLMRLARQEQMGRLDAAMRDWAGSNPVAADAVRRADSVMLTTIERAFRDLGHDRTGARARALLLFSAGVARVHPPWPAGRTVGATILDILVPRQGVADYHK